MFGATRLAHVCAAVEVDPESAAGRLEAMTMEYDRAVVELLPTWPSWIDPALPELGDNRLRHTSTSRSGRRSAGAGQPRPVEVGASGVFGVGATPPGSAGPWSSRNGG